MLETTIKMHRDWENNILKKTPIKNEYLKHTRDELSKILILLQQEVQYLDQLKSGELLNYEDLDSVTFRILYLVSYFHIVYTSIKILNPSTKEDREKARDSLISNYRIKKYCFYCKKTNFFCGCSICNNIACIDCGIIENNSLYHKKCYAKTKKY